MSAQPPNNKPEKEELPPSLKKEEPKKEQNDDDVLSEILSELQSKVGESTSAALKSLPINKQIKILKGIVSGQKEDKKMAKKVEKEEPEEDEEPKDTRKRVTVKKIVKPTDIDGAAADTADDGKIQPISMRFANREEWLSSFMNSDKLYYKGVFRKLG